MGAEQGGRVYAYVVRLDLDGLRLLFADKPTTSKRLTVIKYRSTRAKIAYLESQAVQIIDLCTIAELKSQCRQKVNRYGKPYTENCGECFEWLIAERLGGVQNEKANLKHTEGGDITVNGIAYQVKYERAGIAVG
jgi:hypothetical protein